MAVIKTYSKRKKAVEKSGAPDVYQYDVIPERLREQIVHIFNDGLGTDFRTNDDYKRWQILHDAIAREAGMSKLGNATHAYEKCRHWIRTASPEDALDMIELGATMIASGGMPKRNELIAELNYRFREHAVGYQFENRQLVRIDNQFVHAEIVRPAIARLLSDRAFETANDEFMSAHSNYREKNFKDAVVAANRAFESTLKAICTKKKWEYDRNARATDLIKVVRQHGLFPRYLDSAFDSYIAAMKSGLPGVRNNAGGHGAAPDEPDVPDYVATYAIHLSAANIVMAVDAANS